MFKVEGEKPNWIKMYFLCVMALVVAFVIVAEVAGQCTVDDHIMLGDINGGELVVTTENIVSAYREEREKTRGTRVVLIEGGSVLSSDEIKGVAAKLCVGE